MSDEAPDDSDSSRAIGAGWESTDEEDDPAAKWQQGVDEGVSAWKSQLETSLGRDTEVLRALVYFEKMVELRKTVEAKLRSRSHGPVDVVRSSGFGEAAAMAPPT